MMRLRETVRKNLADPKRVLTAGVGVSIVSLGTAFIAQFAFGLAPCTLCLYQRVPFALAILFGSIGLMFKKHPVVQNSAVFLSGMLFLANGLIAFYHSGVERSWWQSALEGCRVSFEEGKNTENLLDTIL